MTDTSEKGFDTAHWSRVVVPYFLDKPKKCYSKATMPDAIPRALRITEHLEPGTFMFAPLPETVAVIRPNGSREPEDAKLGDDNTYLFYLFDDDLIQQLGANERYARPKWSRAEPFVLEGIEFILVS